MLGFIFSAIMFVFGHPYSSLPDLSGGHRGRLEDEAGREDRVEAHPEHHQPSHTLDCNLRERTEGGAPGENLFNMQQSR